MLRFFCDLPPTLNQSLMPIRIKGRKVLIPDGEIISDTGSIFRDFGGTENEKLRLVHTPEARVFREAAFYQCLAVVNKQELDFSKDEQYGIILIVFLRRNSRDVDNNLKLIIDSVADACGVGHDRNIFKLYTEKIINKGKSHVWVEFGPIEEFILRVSNLIRLSDEDKIGIDSELWGER